ncbi:farnesol dehydrogenase-like [Chironomus tepperi]|uniref:farnesol dehydrogenase-like n=1 Tax=Chironomus tepperi TaxID=113505 RepID=UPI00391F6125
MEKWRGKIAVVTGASSGIGAAIVKDLASNGINVIGLARRSDKVEELARELSHYEGKIYARKCDISDYAALKETFKWIEEKFKVIHILINNAGRGMVGNVLDSNEETITAINQIIDLNLKALINCTREAFRLMKASNDNGFIVNVSSVAGHSIPFPNQLSIYPSTKHAVTAFSEIIRQELIVNNNDKIRMTNLSPGVVQTEIFENCGIENTEAFFTLTPHLKPEDISGAVTYLLGTPYHVNVTEMIIKPVGAKY